MTTYLTQESYEDERVGYDLDATNWVLIATRGSKYAHAPNWTFRRPMDDVIPICGQKLSISDAWSLQGSKDAEGKPPCPRCVRMLRHHIQWLRAWTDSYAALDWSKPEEIPDVH